MRLLIFLISSLCLFSCLEDGINGEIKTGIDAQNYLQLDSCDVVYSEWYHSNGEKVSKHHIEVFNSSLRNESVIELDIYFAIEDSTYFNSDNSLYPTSIVSEYYNDDIDSTSWVKLDSIGEKYLSGVVSTSRASFSFFSEINE